MLMGERLDAFVHDVAVLQTDDEDTTSSSPRRFASGIAITAFISTSYCLVGVD